MLLDACRRGIFADHAGRYALRVVDALDPERSLGRDPLFGGLADRPFRAVFLNYLLDCLPATVLQVEGGLRQLCIRTCLSRGVDLKDYTSASIEELVHLAASPHPEDERPLIEVFGMLALVYAYLPVDGKSAILTATSPPSSAAIRRRHVPSSITSGPSGASIDSWDSRARAGLHPDQRLRARR